MIPKLTKKPKSPSQTGASAPAGTTQLTAAWLTPPWTMEERVRRIEVMGHCIAGYIQFMCKVGSLCGSSPEAKEGAVTAFYDRLVVMERALAKIKEDFELE
jgi:hypothetical protein